MQLTLLKSKIHRATVTGASLDYEGSLTVSADLAELVGLLPYEKILVANLSNGERFETYAIPWAGATRNDRIKRRHRASRENWRPLDHHELHTLHARGSGTSYATHRDHERRK